MDMHEERSLAIQAIANRVQRCLETVRESISRELCAIPTPVPGCDVHFNRLLEDRSKVVDELQRLTQLRSQAASTDALLQFVGSCTSLDRETADQFMRELSTVRAPAAEPSP